MPVDLTDEEFLESPINSKGLTSFTELRRLSHFETH